MNIDAPWLPTLPDGWSVVQARRIATFRNGADYKDVEVQAGGFPVYGSGGEFRRASEYLYDGPSVLFGRKGTIDRPLLVDGKFWTVDTMFFTELEPTVEPRYLHYYALTIPFGYFSTSTALPSMTQSELGACRMPLPPLGHQRTIVDFLDGETARIDTLIVEQERLIETLRERRASVFSHTLDGTAADTPLVRCTTSQVDYRGATPEKTDEGIQLITARNVKAGWIDYERSQEYVAADDYAQIMRRGLPAIGDLLFTMEAPLGNVAVVDRTDIALAQRMIKWTVDQTKASPRFLMYAILSGRFQEQLRLRATGSTALGLKASKLPELRIFLPALDDQTRIVRYLDTQVSKIDTLIGETERFISLARERRAALITAAVTGQMDVRDPQPVEVG